MKKSSPVPTRSAFTLIELLIVIAIIGILMSLLFPAVNSAIDAAKKASAQNDVTQIATAITAYNTEYGRLPGTGSSDTMGIVNKALTDILSGVANNTNNPRQIVFLEIQPWKKGKGGTNTSGEYLDPWGGKYQVALDGDYDNTLTGVGTNGSTASLRKTVAVWSDPSTQTNPTPTTSQKPRRYVTSW